MERPVSVTVCAILAIVVGACGLLCNPCNLVMVLQPHRAMGNAVLDGLMGNGVYKSWMIVASSVGFVTALLLIIAGIGLLFMAPWARWLAIGYGVYKVIFDLVEIGIVIVVLIPLFQTASGPEAIGMVIGGIIGGACGALVTLAYPAVLLVILLRADTAAAFRRRE